MHGEGVLLFFFYMLIALNVARERANCLVYAVPCSQSAMAAETTDMHPRQDRIIDNFILTIYSRYRREMCLATR